MSSKPMALNLPKARLRINGQIRHIKGFSLEAPSGALGYRLNCQLLDSTLVINEDDDISFELGNERGGVESMLKYIDTGRIAGRRHRLAFRGDTLIVDAVNPLADKWAITTREPELLYDPNRVEIEEERKRTNNDVLDEQGRPIAARLTPVTGLDLKYIHHHAYVEKLEFVRVVTNLPNYPIRMAEFSIRESYHKAAQQFTTFFEPHYFADDNGQMFILDPQRQLPEGFAALARQVTPGKPIEVQFNRPAGQLTNAILLTYQVDDNEKSGLNRNTDFPPTVTDRVESEPVESGESGKEGYSIQITTRHLKEFHDDDRDPQRVTREVVYEVVIDSYAWNKQENKIELISTEVQTDLYTRDWRLKTGHNRTVQALVQIPDSPKPIFLQVLNEESRTKWKAGLTSQEEYTRQWTHTFVEGFILIEGDASNPNTALTKMPLLDATRTRNVSQDGIQRIEYGPISTVYEQYRPTGTNQLTITLTKIDHLTPMMESSKAVQHIADQSIDIGALNANTGARKTVTELIRDEDSEEEFGPREPLALNAGEVPVKYAVEVAKRKLKRKGQPLGTVTVELANFDVNLRRGSIRRVDPRAGTGDPYIVTGFRITGQNLGLPEGRITQNFDAIICQNE